MRQELSRVEEILRMFWGRQKKNRALQISASWICVTHSVDMSVISWLQQRIIGDNIGVVGKNQTVKNLNLGISVL